MSEKSLSPLKYLNYIKYRKKHLNFYNSGLKMVKIIRMFCCFFFEGEEETPLKSLLLHFNI